MRMPPPLESSHYQAIAAATTAAFDQHRVHSSFSQASPVPPTHGFPTVSNQELPQLQLNGPSVSAAMPPNAHYHPSPPLGNVNGTMAGSLSYPPHHDAPPHSAPLESTNVEPSAHSIQHAQYPGPAPAPTFQTPASFGAPYQIQAHGMRRGKAPRAQQVRQTHAQRETEGVRAALVIKLCSH